MARGLRLVDEGEHHSQGQLRWTDRTSPPASAEEESKNMLPTYYIYFQIHQYKLPINHFVPT